MVPESVDYSKNVPLGRSSHDFGFPGEQCGLVRPEKRRPVSESSRICARRAAGKEAAVDRSRRR